LKGFKCPSEGKGDLLGGIIGYVREDGGRMEMENHVFTDT
jgi:hypothetical protein